MYINCSEVQNKNKKTICVLICASTNPQYDDRLFIELRVQYMKISNSEHVQNMLCIKIVFCFCSAQFMYITCSEHVLSLQFSCTELVIQ